MCNLLPSSIIFIMLSIVKAKYLPMRVRQAPPASTPAVLILAQNSGCCLLSSALSVCTSLTPGFTTLAPSQQAPCLCYSSTVWAPDIFDNAVKTCADFASTAFPSAYSPIYNLENFCANVGNAYGPASAVAATTSAPSNPACNLVNSLIEVCTSLSPGFATMSATHQASCLCYVSSSTWMPTLFDNAVSTCVDFAKTAETSIWPVVESLEGFCSGVGNIMSTGAVTTTTMPPVTTSVQPSAAGSAGSAASKTSTDSTPTTSIDLTITIGGGGAATDTATVSKNNGSRRKVSGGEILLVSFVCAAVLLFLC